MRMLYDINMYNLIFLHPVVISLNKYQKFDSNVHKNVRELLAAAMQPML